MIITLVNAWSDDNKGDLGIAEGTIHLIKKAIPKSEIKILSIFHNESKINLNHRHLLSCYPDIEILPSLYSNNIVGHCKFGVDYLFEKEHPLIRKKSINSVVSSDMIVGLGGHWLFNYRKYNPRSYGRLINLLSPFAIAKKFNIPYFLLGHSIGPFDDFISKHIVNFFLKNATLIYTRESISAKMFIKDLGFDNTKIKIIPDCAFYLTPLYSERIISILSDYKLEKNKFWVITVRKWTDKKNNEFFLNEMAKLIKKILSNNLTDRVVLVANTLGPTKIEDDRDITALLYKKVKELPVVKIEDDLLPRELVALYGEAELLIGTRFHSVIFALDAGTPVYAISYYGPKAWGIMEMLGMKDLCIDMESFTSEDVYKRLKSLNPVSLRTTIMNKISNFRRQLEEAICGALREK